MSFMLDCEARFGYAEDETLSLVSAADAKKKAPTLDTAATVTVGAGPNDCKVIAKKRD